MDKELKVLIVEDKPADAELAAINLKTVFKKLTFEVVDTEEEYLQALQDFEPNLIISDYKLPNFNGLSALKIKQEKSPLTPFVLFTGSQNEATAVECMKAGADDYVLKDHIMRLGPAVLSTLEKKKIEREQIIALEALQESEEQYRGLFENALVGVGISNLAGKVLATNKTMSNMTGYSLEEFSEVNIGDTYVDLKSRDIFLDILKQDKQVENYEVQLLNKEGEKYWANLSSKKITFNGEDATLTTALDITDRKLSELKISRFSQIFEDSLNEVYLFETDSTKFIQVNKAAQDNIGYTMEELFQLTPLDIKPKLTAESFNKLIAPLKDGTKNKIVFETSHKRKDGSLYDVEVHLQLLQFAQESIFAAIILDITDRKQAERILIKNQYYLTKAQELGVIGTWELDIQKNNLKWTDEAYKIFDVPPGTAMNLDLFFDCIHPEDRDYVAEQWNAGLEHEPYDIEHRVVTNDTVKWVREKSDIEFDPDGNPVMAIGFVQDITERKTAEQALVHSRDLMTYVIEHNKSAIAVHDRDLNYIYVSKRYLDAYNVKDRDIIGKHHYDVFPDLPQKWRDVHQKALAGQISSADKDPYEREDGSVDWTRWECRPWYEVDGSIGGFIIYTEVITDSIQAEQEKDILLRQVQEANTRLKSLSRELINSQEEERKRISQELHDDLGQALTAITLDLKIIERDLDPKTPQHIIERLLETKTIADELDKKVGEIALDLRPSLLDDLGLLPAINWYTDRWSQRTEVKVKIESIGNEDRLLSEIETAIYRIIQESLTNVAKHAQAKIVRLQIIQKSKSININIEDDGRGFNIEDFQTSQSDHQGLGLLGMADRISLIGGQIEIRSKPGEGTRIEIQIPL